jgi:hypothetical protein
LVSPGQLLRSIHQILAPSGIVAIALPNVLMYRNRVKFLFGKFEYTTRGIMDETHVRFYTFETGKRLLEQHGYEIILARATGGLPLYKLRQVLSSKSLWTIDRIACALVPGLFGLQSLYLARSLSNTNSKN